MQLIKRSNFIFEENHVFIEEKLSNKVVTVEEELDEIDIDRTGNLMNVPRLLFVDEECGNLGVVVDGGQLTRDNNRKRKSEVLQAYKCPLCEQCFRRD